jgi:2-amino-4-hydroxy-6-hydroxymethyldihydropteridine diphosphokinase
VERAIEGLREFGAVLRRSSLYRTRPWGYAGQPDFVNAVVTLSTDLSPLDLLRALQALERRLGRVPGIRWGPRAIDLDILTYDDVQTSDAGLRLPHPHLYERAFVLVPLAEIDPAFARARDALDPVEVAGVAALGDTGAEPRVSPPAGGSLAAMSRDAYAADRIRRLAEFLAASDVVSLRIDREDTSVELGRRFGLAPVPASPAPDVRVDTIRADLVGIFRLARPAPVAGESFAADRELAHIEALGIRNPVHSLGGGRIVSIATGDGSPVEYGQPLFLLDRG